MCKFFLRKTREKLTREKSGGCRQACLAVQQCNSATYVSFGASSSRVCSDAQLDICKELAAARTRRKPVFVQRRGVALATLLRRDGTRAIAGNGSAVARRVDGAGALIQYVKEQAGRSARGGDAARGQRGTTVHQFCSRIARRFQEEILGQV